MQRRTTMALAAFTLLHCLTGSAAEPVKNIVLVHGALVDGSGWRPVYDILKKDGYKVSIVQQPLTGFDADLAATKRVLDLQDGPVVLVGQSYGGFVVTAAGNDAKVKALVYVAAFAPAEGESVGDLGQRFVSASGKDIKATKDGYIYMSHENFIKNVMADVDPTVARFAADSQTLTDPSAFGVKMSAPAWKNKPSYGIVTTEDRTIEPRLLRFMYERAGSTIVELKASHAVYLSQPRAVAKVIEQAARGK
ncbi:alpha/beta fold hydrolase [Massilia sp. CMS3.1]|uniref:alpha/beta fold hydrolase n=1 Tax=Massilia sp. CMS3.1 TaxID=3373083 RepID=UPI003EE6CD45